MARAHTQAEAIRLHRQAQAQLKDKLAALKRLTTSIELWQRRAAYYGTEAGITDEARAQRTVERRAAAEKAWATMRARRPSGRARVDEPTPD